ncbi:MAG TPA: DUF899 domain-containing protein [Streptosporangiaceae bacterium]|jgi:predicted dithiol-disulfide oxidoreductase (DUF899 family)|nr:DUF899 domain-containing protein [Streptosporangiaceae bacterium]
MSLPEVVTPEEWLVARKELLAREKENTRQRDALNAERRRLPMVAVSKDYQFEGPSGPVSLGDMFDGCRQLIVQHVMFDPAWDAACPGCTAGLDEMAPGMLAHLRKRDTAFAGVSRAPLAKLSAYRAQRGWTFDWYSSYGSDFNYDFHATLDSSVAPVMYNFRTPEEEGSEPDPGSAEMPGLSCFLLDGDRIFHTYSTWARGSDQLGNAYTFLDLTVLGRQETWEEPKDRVTNPHPADPTFLS